MRKGLPRREEGDGLGVVEELSELDHQVVGLAPVGRDDEDRVVGLLCEGGDGERAGGVGSGERQAGCRQVRGQRGERLVGAHRLCQAVQKRGGCHSAQSRGGAPAPDRRPGRAGGRVRER